MAVTTITRFPPPVPEALNQIFAHSEKTDLLNIRLVCQDWNQDCLNFLKKSSSKFRITLSHRKDWESYVKFVSSLPKVKGHDNNQKQKLEPVMPIHLIFKSKKPFYIMETTVYRDSDSSDSDSDDSDSDDENANKFKSFQVTVKKLLRIFGSNYECVRDLTFCYSPYDDDILKVKLVKILRKLSPGLEKLEMKLNIPNMEEKDQVVFPKLKYLSFDWYTKNFDRLADYEGGNTTWKLIQGCPNLETLILGDILEKDTNHWPSDLPFPPAGIKSFKFLSIPNHWLLDKMIKHPSLPNLENLSVCKFRIIGIDDDTLIQEFRNCREILRLFSPTLRQSLSIRLISTIGNDYYENEHVPVPFPLFPALKNLTIKDSNMSALVEDEDSTDDSNFIIDPEAFPVLESVSIPFDLKLNEGVETQFPTVKSLEYFLFVYYFNQVKLENEEKKAKIMDKFTHFQNLFPNECTITFRNNNKYGGLEYGGLIKQHLQKFMQLPDASKIKTLELINFDQNYLGVLLHQIRHPPRFILENMGGRNPLLEPKLVKTFEMLTNNTLGAEVNIREEERLTIVELDNSAFQNYLTNIEKIRLVLTKGVRLNFRQECQWQSQDGNLDERKRTEFEEYEKSINEPKKLYLNVMMSFFPKLEKIEISSVMFAKGSIGRAERIERIREKFPGLKINII